MASPLVVEEVSFKMVMTSSINSGSQFSTGSGTFVDVTGYNCTITPKFSTSKILITSNPIILLNNGSGGYKS